MHNTLFVVKDQLFARKRHLSPFLPQQSKKLITPRSATAADLGAIKKGERNNEKALIGSIFIQRFSLFLFDYMIAEAVENRNKQFENNYAQNPCLPRPAGAPGKNPPVLRNRGIRTILLRTASAAGSHVFYSRIDTQDLRQLVSGDSPHYRKLAKCLMVRTI